MVIHAVQRAHLSHLRCKGEGQLIRAGADICRVPASTLRFCEEKGLIALSGGAACAVCSLPACWNDWR